jgi:hypothetical protein
MMPTMPAQKPQPNRAPIPYTLNVRLTKAQYAYLLMRAEVDGSLGAALRQVLDEVIDSRTIWSGPDDDAYDTGEPLRPWLDRADLDNLDPETIALVARQDDDE